MKIISSKIRSHFPNVLRTKMTLILFLVSILITPADILLGQQSQLTVNGWFDLEFEVSDKNEEGKISDFDNHHFNVLTNYKLDDHFRVMTEIEWEHGASIEANSSGAEGTGLIALERAWLEYRHSDAVTIKAGKFLTPFGIMNLYHDATPTYLTSFLPSAIYGKHKYPTGGKGRLYPKFANGLQVTGSIGDVEYYGYVANGRGANPYKADDNFNKLVGGRVIFSLKDNILLGASYYTEKNGVQYDTEMNSLGLDGILEISDLRIQAELASSNLEKVDTKISTSYTVIDTAGNVVVENITTTYTPNGTFLSTLGYYVEFSYSLGRLTPVLRFDYFNPDTDANTNRSQDILVGVNFAVTAWVYLKADVQFWSPNESGDNDYKMFTSSVSVAF